MSSRPRRSAAKAAQIVISKVTGRLQDRQNTDHDTSASESSSEEDMDISEDIKPDIKSTTKSPRGGRGRKRERSPSPYVVPKAASPKKTGSAPTGKTVKAVKGAPTIVSVKGSPPKKVIKIVHKSALKSGPPDQVVSEKAGVGPVRVERVKKVPPPPPEADIDEIEDELDGENVDIVVVDNSALKYEISEDAFDDSSTDEDENGEPLKAAGLSNVIELGKGTTGRCGKCHGCKRPKCGECSACKRGDLVNCIDDYCTEDEKGRAVRAAAKELYIKSQTKADGHPSNNTTALSNATILKNKELSMGRSLDNRTAKPVPLKLDNNASRNVKKKPADYVYGASASAAKSRRCGECEGCMRDDCGECVPCKDKPRFGGRGTKKRACTERTCRLKTKTLT
ncbi:hypothetical protein TCAL_14979 [Tigriopus californicus]|uniref:CXXC-type domain-containing protein n=1 Tax=Tigriopus californicus TaxID=6832 RepID=A0A553N7M7_TIGCA|nr:hypothetical protein TCAL_14979 [Tigriopus californicus]